MIPRMICLIVPSIGMRSIRYSTRPTTTSVTMMPMIPGVKIPRPQTSMMTGMISGRRLMFFWM